MQAAGSLRSLFWVLGMDEAGGIIDGWGALMAYNNGLPRKQECFLESWEAGIIIGLVTKRYCKDAKDGERFGAKRYSPISLLRISGF